MFKNLLLSKRKDVMPISDCEVRDPRMRRTRQLLQGALRTLMLTRNFEEISVQEIAEAATVNRATFYDHYTDKFALLEALIAGGFHCLLHERDVRYDSGCPAQAAVVIIAVCDYLVITHQGGGCKDQSPFEPLIDAAIVGAIRRVLAKSLLYAEAGASLLSEMVTTAASNAIYGAAREWLRSANRVSAEEIAPQILAIVRPILQMAPTCPARSTKMTDVTDVTDAASPGLVAAT
jgi:AcrR family transcriptional regulator